MQSGGLHCSAGLLEGPLQGAEMQRTDNVLIALRDFSERAIVELLDLSPELQIFAYPHDLAARQEAPQELVEIVETATDRLRFSRVAH